MAREPCGCVIRCPLHKAAPEMLNACKGALLGFEAIDDAVLPFEWRVLRRILSDVIKRAQGG